MGFDVVVLMAQEHQPRSVELPGIRVVHCPIDDDPRGLSSRGYAAAEQCADLVASEVRSGRNVLVTCAAGLNRSGLVTALALRNMYRIPGVAAVAHVQSRRPGALSNSAFAEYVRDRLPRMR